MSASVREIYRQSRKTRDNLWNVYVSRPPAALVVWLLAPTPITPNQVTFLSLAVFAGAAAALIFWRTHLGLLVAAAVLQSSYILDCVDGQLARYKDMSSPVGALLDFLMDEFKAVLLIGSASVRQYLLTGHVWWLLVGIGGLGAATMGVALTSFMRRPEYLAATGDRHESATGMGEAAPPPRRSPAGHVALAGLALGHLVMHYPSWIWALAIANRLDWFLYVYLGGHALYLGRASLIVLIKLGRPGRPRAAAALVAAATTTSGES